MKRCMLPSLMDLTVLIFCHGPVKVALNSVIPEKAGIQNRLILKALDSESMLYGKAVRHSGVQTRLYQASSSEMYGDAPAPQNEQTPHE